jgi:glycerophosphoryl diester phosphodiesterase
MKTLLFSLLFSTILLIGCANDSTDLTAPDSQITQKSTSPNWVKLPGDKGQNFSVESEYSAQKLITGKDGGVIKLNVKIKRPGHEFGDFIVKSKVKVKKHSFPDNEERLFTITLDPNNAYINITPSPNTLDKHIKVSWMIKGIDVSDINPNTFDFFYVGDNNEMLETSKEELTVDYDKHKIKVKRAKIHPITSKNSPGGSRYGFVH